MTYLLDTNACISVLRKAESPLAARLAATKQTNVFVCSIVRAELCFGAFRSRQSERALETVKHFLSGFRSLPFDDPAANVYGKLRADLAQQGKLIGPHDLLIAAIALANQTTLVTHNLDEFSRVPGLQIEDWE